MAVAAPQTPVVAAQAEAQTLPAVFARVVQERGERSALYEKREGRWRAVTWTAYGRAVHEVASGLLELGLQPGDRVCIFAHNGPCWLYADLGTLCAGGVSVGIYTTCAAQQVEYQINDSGARFLFAGDAEQLEKVLAVSERTPALEKIIVLDAAVPEAEAREQRLLGLEALRERGRALEAGDRQAWDRAVARVRPADAAIIMYTSGTTGPPKGACLSHENVMFQLLAQDEVLHYGGGDELLSYLPLSHIGERLLGAFRPILCGAVISFAESQAALVANMRERSPTVFFGVPRIWEKIHAAITAAQSRAPAWRRLLLRAAFAAGDHHARRLRDGVPVPGWLALLHRVAERRILRPCRDLVGLGRARFIIAGAAPIAPSLIRWLFALGLDVRETYGMTETTGVISIAPVERRKLGTVGRPLPGTEVQIAGDGEILVRGPHVFEGYINKPEQTAEALAGGWLHTGDLGALDEEGFLSIRGRKKDIIITAGGKNVSPATIENALKFSPYVADALAVGEGRKYLACLIVPDRESVIRYAREHGLQTDDFAALCVAPEILALFEREVERVNAGVSRVEQVKKFRVLDAMLSPETGEVTATMKLKRDTMTRRYADIVDSMYADPQ